MRPRHLILALVLTLPSAVLAQRGGGGGGGGGGSGGGGAPGMDRRDLEHLDPVAFLLDKKKDVKIDDAQKKSLEALRDSADAINKVLIKRIDSVQVANRPRTFGVEGAGGPGGGGALPVGASAEETRAKATAGKTLVSESLKELQKNYAAARERALALLTEAQRPKAVELLDKNTKELAEKLGLRAEGNRGGS